MRSTSSTVVGMGPCGAEGHVGIGGAEDEVDLVEELGHASTIVRAGTSRCLGRLHGSKWWVAMLTASMISGVSSDSQAGVAVAEVDQQAAPFRPAAHSRPPPRQVDRHVHPLQSGVGDQGVGRLLDASPGPPRPRPPPRGRRRRATRLPAESKVAEPGLPPLDPGQAEGVVRVGAVADVVPAGRVAHRPRQAADDRGEAARSRYAAPWGCARRSPSARTAR